MIDEWFRERGYGWQGDDMGGGNGLGEDRWYG